MKKIYMVSCFMTVVLSSSIMALDDPKVVSSVDSDDQLLLDIQTMYPLATTYVKPEHPSGLRLDWCKNWASNCGKPAADAFCVIKGHSYSSGFAQASQVGLTRVLQDNRMVCWGQPCDSFRYIACE